MFNMADKNLYNADYAFSPTDGQIVDLSRLARKLTAYEDISDDLSEDEERRIVDYVKSCSDMSYNKIKKRYAKPTWPLY